VSSRRLARGDIVTARFPEHRPPGHEQEGPRPAVVVGLPDRLGQPRFPTILLVPLTTDRGQEWALRSPDLYPRLAAGVGGLARPSIALIDQTRALSVDRLVAYIGTLAAADFASIHTGLQRILEA
jgi:mRNA interferase MazF